MMKKFLLVFMFAAAAAFVSAGCGRIDYVKEITGLKISASSTLDSKTAPWNHHPIYLMDENPATAWQEGDEKSHGEGTTITIDLAKPIGFNLLKAVNGFAKYESYAEENAQFKDIEISAEVRGKANTKKSATATLKKVVFVKDPKTNKATPQEERIKLDKILIGDRIVITLKSVHPGTKYKDTCLSEIKFGLETQGKDEIFPNKSMDYITKNLEDMKLQQYHNYVFYGLKETTKNSPDCNDLRTFGNNGSFSMKIYHNGTVERSAAVGYDKAGTSKEFITPINGSFTVEGIDAKEVTISVKSSTGEQETWLITRVVGGDDNWNSMKTEFGTDFNRIITAANTCLLTKITVMHRGQGYVYYTYLSPKFDCNANCGTGN